MWLRLARLDGCRDRSLLDFKDGILESWELIWYRFEKYVWDAALYVKIVENMHVAASQQLAAGLNIYGGATNVQVQLLLYIWICYFKFV